MSFSLLSVIKYCLIPFITNNTSSYIGNEFTSSAKHVKFGFDLDMDKVHLTYINPSVNRTWMYETSAYGNNLLAVVVPMAFEIN
jgi:hypothetical protein